MFTCGQLEGFLRGQNLTASGVNHLLDRHSQPVAFPEADWNPAWQEQDNKSAGLRGMSDSGARLFGPVARRLLSPDHWTDEYPAWPAWGRELDALLLFADEQGRLPHFLPRLESRNTQRDEALSELRVAYLLHHCQFPIVQWEPPGLNRKVGEYLIITAEGQHVFVEVKSPGWEGELSEEELRAGRAKLAKYHQRDGGAIGNWRPLRRCIASERTYPKFVPTLPNLLIVADDLRVCLHDSLNHVEIALYGDHKLYGEAGYFTSPKFQNLGGVGIFRALSKGDGIDYEFRLFDNPFALPSTKLPSSLLRFKTKISGVGGATFAA